jgi:hypothetical protein
MVVPDLALNPLAIATATAIAITIPALAILIALTTSYKALRLDPFLAVMTPG